MPGDTRAKRFWVSGIVQGVGYRYFARRVALRLGIAGYVKNLSDGSVEVYAVGEPDKLEALRKELEEGPRSASVDGVAEEDADVEPAHANGFTIEGGGW